MATFNDQVPGSVLHVVQPNKTRCFPGVLVSTRGMRLAVDQYAESELYGGAGKPASKKDYSKKKDDGRKDSKKLPKKDSKKDAKKDSKKDSHKDSHRDKGRDRDLKKDSKHDSRKDSKRSSKVPPLTIHSAPLSQPGQNIAKCPPHIGLCHEVLFTKLFTCWTVVPHAVSKQQSCSTAEHSLPIPIVHIWLPLLFR